MIYWPITSFRPQLSGTGERTSLVNYICGVVRKSFLSRMLEFPGSHEAALPSHNFCNVNLLFSVPFSVLAHSPLILDCLLHLSLHHYVYPLVFYPVLPPFLISHYFFTPVLHCLLPEQIRSFMCCSVFPLFSSSHSLMASLFENILQKRDFLGSPHTGLFVSQHPKSPHAPVFVTSVVTTNKHERKDPRKTCAFGSVIT